MAKIEEEKTVQIKFIDLTAFLNPARTEKYYKIQQDFAITSVFRVTNAGVLVVHQAECT
jgi:hypothetical protein